MLSIEREKLLRGNISQAFGLGLHLLHRHRDPLSDTNRVEATIFAASEPVTRSVLARVVGRECNLDLLIDDIRAELAGRPYDLVAVAGGFRHLTRPAYADAIRSAFGTAVGADERGIDLSQSEVLVLMCIAHFQPITRAELSTFFHSSARKSAAI